MSKQNSRLVRAAFALSLCVVSGGAAVASAYDPTYEVRNFGKGSERSAIYLTPEYQQKLQMVGLANSQAALRAQLDDPERSFTSDACWSGNVPTGCAGDVRLYDWQRNGYGIVAPVLYTARNGATISGHVWATKAGPAKRPGVVIASGSYQAVEQFNWYAAQTLAKAGYVVLTTDPQGQGQSDTFGEGPDRGEGFPAQSDGRPFFDGAQDAVNFFFSTQDQPYRPVASCSTGTSHAAKQARRATAGLDAAFNPYAALLDPSRVGIAGYSYSAAGVSYIGQSDPRLKAIVAWDNLGPPVSDSPAATDPTSSDAAEAGCKDAAARRPAAITKPALGMSADYYYYEFQPHNDTDPLAKSQESLAYSKAGVDTGEIIIRGGTHYDFAWIPNPGFRATLRGADEIAWYTTAWFDKYVKGDPGADKRLLTNRWRHDAQEAAVDPFGDGNMMSQYYRSRLDVRLAGGKHFRCEDLRAGCPGLVDNDGVAGSYDFVSIARSPDTAQGR